MKKQAAAGDAIEQFMAALEHPRKAEIEELRAVLRRVDPRIGEAIKWNAPSYCIDDHFATFKLRPGDTVQIVFHTGARPKRPGRKFAVADPAGLLTWAAPDRCIATLPADGSKRSQHKAIAAIARQWIAQL